MNKETAIMMRNNAKNRANNKCEICGKNTLLIVRTNHCFFYPKFMETGEIKQRELSLVCESCSNKMVTMEKVNTDKIVNYIVIAPSGELLEYQK